MKTKDITRINIEQESYPKLLREIKNAPSHLFALGNAEDLDRPSIAIVGTRKATQAGIKIAESIAYHLGKRGFTIVSGLAMGIDSAAHRGALKAGAKTIAVLGTTLNRIYPAQNENLAKEILATGGAVISEHAAGHPGHKGIFLDRNRIISGLAVATVCVEVPIKSGAVSTANWAGDQGRSVFVIPGPINHPNYAGSHKLIRDGATLVASVEDILEDLGINTKESLERQGTLEFTDESLKFIFEAIKDAGSPISTDEIIDITGLEADIVNVNLATLVIQKIISETSNGYTV